MSDRLKNRFDSQEKTDISTIFAERDFTHILQLYLLTVYYCKNMIEIAESYDPPLYDPPSYDPPPSYEDVLNNHFR